MLAPRLLLHRERASFIRLDALQAGPSRRDRGGGDFDLLKIGRKEFAAMNSIATGYCALPGCQASTRRTGW